jgi:hypothetical protein
MKLVYDVIEDAYDDTTQIRSMTEQAQLPSREWLIRTTVYTPHQISIDVTHIRGKRIRNACSNPCSRDRCSVIGPKAMIGRFWR